MLLLAMVIESFAVIGKKNDQRGLVKRMAAEIVEKSAHRGVRGRDLPIIGTRRVLRAKGFRWRVRRMRLVDVQKQKEGFAPDCNGIAPGFQLRRSLRSGPLVRRALRELVVVEIETGGEASLPSERKRRDRRPRRISPGLQERRESRMGVIQAKSEIVANSILVGEKTRQKRRMGWQRQRDVGIGILKKHRIPPERVERGSRDTFVTVCRKMVGSQGVHGNDHDARESGDDRRRTGARQKCRTEQSEDSPGSHDPPPILARICFAVAMSRPYSFRGAVAAKRVSASRASARIPTSAAVDPRLNRAS